MSQWVEVDAVGAVPSRAVAATVECWWIKCQLAEWQAFADAGHASHSGPLDFAVAQLELLLRPLRPQEARAPGGPLTTKSSLQS